MIAHVRESPIIWGWPKFEPYLVALTTHDELRQAWPCVPKEGYVPPLASMKEGVAMTPSPVSPYGLFVGVDIAAATASVAWMTSDRKVSRALTIDQTAHGFSALQQRLLASGHPAHGTLVVMEATGSYWMTLATTLTQAGFAVSVINPAQAHHFARIPPQASQDGCH
jgi:hypothetical protein